MYDFDEQTLSDLHKDARGFRPRGEFFWSNWAAADADGKQAIWDGLIRELDRVQAEEAHAAEVAIANFEGLVGDTIYTYGAADRETALRWLTSEETFYHSQDVEHWVYNQGILFTDYGREIVKELMDIVTFKEWETE